MFTGLIADVGALESIQSSDDGARLAVFSRLAAELAPGDSVAVDGACLTVAARSGDRFEADVINQTLKLTSLGALEVGGAVNLEPALRAQDRLGGHIVQGHVDGVGSVAALSDDGIARRLELEVPADLRRYVAEHGSITCHGVSLTVSALTATGAEVSLIPETLERTTLGGLGIGDPLNIEVDVIARYAERLLQGFDERSGDDG